MDCSTEWVTSFTRGLSLHERRTGMTKQSECILYVRMDSLVICVQYKTPSVIAARVHSFRGFFRGTCDTPCNVRNKKAVGPTRAMLHDKPMQWLTALVLLDGHPSRIFPTLKLV